MDDSVTSSPAKDLNQLDLDTVSKQSQHSDSAVVDEFRRIGRTALEQVLGRKPSVGYSDEDIKKMKASDDDFSEREYIELRRKIEAIYEEYRAKRKQELEEKEQEEEQKKANELARLYELRKGPIGADVGVNTAVSKGSAETGKNWGSE